MNSPTPNEIELILGNSNKRFSGVTSTMLQVLSRQWSLLPVAVLGDHFLPKQATAISFLSLIKHGRSPLADGRFRIFHARRNNEMIQALILKMLFRVKIKIVFTSTAQRHHTGFTRWLIKQMDGIISTCDAAAARRLAVVARKFATEAGKRPQLAARSILKVMKTTKRNK